MRGKFSQRRNTSLKNISDHSTGAYKELCAGLGSTFEAVPTNQQSEACSNEGAGPHSTSSFSAKIDELSKQNAALIEEGAKWRATAERELISKEGIQSTLDEAVTLNQKLQKDIDARDITISTLRRTLEEHSQMFSRMLPVIRELYSFGDMITI